MLSLCAMSWVAGVDGCRRGWFRVCRDTDSGALRFDLVERVAELFDTPPGPRVVAIDMPIGLSEAGPRDCDRAARALLGPRRSSVFPAPIRAAVGAPSRLEADHITRRSDGRGVAAQAFGLYPKIFELDRVLLDRSSEDLDVREVHPEVSFWAWNGESAMPHAKKDPRGAAERNALVAAWLGAQTLERARGGHPKKDLADDDILDAIACLWTAHRIASGTARCLPEAPPHDGVGLPMRIVY